MQVIENPVGNRCIIYTGDLDSKALDQVRKLCHFEAYYHSKIRVMPDAHAGKGCTIGTTMTIDDKVTPNLVGVDIGCGMLTIRLQDGSIDFSRLEDFIRQRIPHGRSIHRCVQEDFDLSGLRCGGYADLDRARLSLGSLGGGNHFIEVGKGEQSGDLFLVIHSGSRKLGTDVCGYYQKLAIDKLSQQADLKGHTKGKRKKGKLPFDRDLAYLTGRDFDDYLHDMSVVQKYASKNREVMAALILDYMGLKESERFETIHNYIDFGRMILRKGAVSAERGEKLLIPVNMRDGSLLCTGKGNESWNYSAPHGAGRLLSRRKAREKLKMDDYKRAMKGVYTRSVSSKTIDEAPDAYKSMDHIRAGINDTAILAEVIKPLYNFKAPD